MRPGTTPVAFTDHAFGSFLSVARAGVVVSDRPLGADAHDLRANVSHRSRLPNGGVNAHRRMNTLFPRARP